MFILYRKPLAPARKPYRLGLPFIHKNGDLGAISATARAKLRRADLESGASHIG